MTAVLTSQRKEGEVKSDIGQRRKQLRVAGAEAHGSLEERCLGLGRPSGCWPRAQIWGQEAGGAGAPLQVGA